MASEAKNKVELGYGGTNTKTGLIRADEFDRALKGRNAIKNFRLMRDTDPTVGAVMYAVEQVLRDVPFSVVPANDSDEAKAEAKFVEEVFDDMDHTLDDHISEALSHLTFGFSDFEVVYKRRNGPQGKNPKKKSKYSDGRLGIRKLASRAQWTIDKFDVDQENGDFLGIIQQNFRTGSGSSKIPVDKLVHYTTTTTNNDFSGRSILRNAYKPFHYVNELQRIEATGIERELHGMPIAYMPAEYLSEGATDDQKALVASTEKILRDVRYNEEGYMLLPSDPWVDADGKPTGGVGSKRFDLKLITSEGTRNIDVRPVIRDYQAQIADSVLASFISLGKNGVGSYAMDESKKDLFLRSVESYINSIFDVLNKQLITRLWEFNSLDVSLMPTLKAGDVAPKDLQAISGFLRNLSQANIAVWEQPSVVGKLMEYAELPFDQALYEKSVVERKEVGEVSVRGNIDTEKARAVKEGNNEDED